MWHATVNDEHCSRFSKNLHSIRVAGFTRLCNFSCIVMELLPSQACNLFASFRPYQQSAILSALHVCQVYTDDGARRVRRFLDIAVPVYMWRRESVSWLAHRNLDLPTVQVACRFE